MSLVESARDGGVLTVTLADVDRRNVLSAGLLGELVAVLDEADADPDVRVVVVTNRGPVFCAGADLSARPTAPGDATPADAIDPVAVFGRFRHSPKPYVGRIAGHCVAGGMGLLAGLDITVAPDTARFGFTEVRVGVAPAMISVVCLPKLRAVDAQAAFLRGHRFPAAEAARMGLLTYAVPGDRLDDTVTEIVTDLLAGAPGALAAAKQLTVTVPTLPVDAAFAWTKELSARLFAGEEAAAGMAAFLGKRPAPWVPGAGDPS